MELNENSKERIALKVLAAMENEKLMNKEAAGIFDASPVYFSNLKHYAEKRDKPNYVPAGLWTALRAWYYSNKPLRGYKLPTQEELLEPVPAEVSETAMYGFVAALFACAVAVVLNSIDESQKTFEEKYGIENNQNTES